MSASEYSGTCARKGRGRPRGKTERSRQLIDTAYGFLEEAHPTTVRGVCYALFVRGVIPSMALSETRRMSRLLTYAREEGIVPWSWIVDETRSLEGWRMFADPSEFVADAVRTYARDAWAYQPYEVQVWSEKGTVRGVLHPTLERYGVAFQVVHGFGSSTTVYDVANSRADKPLVILYVGDWDPSGLYMSQRDLPERIGRYGGDHVEVRRIALAREDLDELPSFSAETKKRDPRYKWFTEYFGSACWELDAMHPTALRDRVAQAIEEWIEWEPWERCLRAQEAERESLERILASWSAS